MSISFFKKGSSGDNKYNVRADTTISNVFQINEAITELINNFTISDNVTSLSQAFIDCKNLTSIPLLNTSNIIDMYQAFSGCEKLVSIPQLDTSKVTNMGYLFNDCVALKTVPLLDASSIKAINIAFRGCEELIEMGGLKNLGKAYTQRKQNYAPYCLSLAAANKLTHESLMNVINNLYDLNLSYNVADGGTLYRQQFNVGTANLAKLTEDEIAIATAKGWDIIE